MNILDLRRLAEQEISHRGAPERFDHHGTEILHELHVHQIELEIQNEELRRIQCELEETAAKYLDLFDLSPIGYLTLDRQGRIVEANRTAEGLLGLPRHLLSRRPLDGLMSEEDADCFQLHLRRAFQLRVTERSDLRIRRPDGSSFPVLLASTVPPLRDICLTTIVDLTEKRRAEEELREAVERFGQLTHQIDDVFFIFQPSVRQVLYLSPAFERLLGLPASYAMDRRTSLLDWIHPDDRGRVLRASAAFMAGGPLDMELRIIRADGVLRIARVRAFLISGQDRVAGVVTDVTEERRLEEELRHAQKMEAVGALASGIAHDFNNLLMGVIGFATVALTRMDATHPAYREVKRVVDIGKRGEALTRQLLDFSRKRPAHASPIELDAIVSECKPLLETLLGESIGVVMRMGARSARVRADAGEIEQMLMNLATNARDSMPNGGLLEIETAEVDRHAILTVRDTGSGMDEQTKQRIFEPFFTTKGIGEGTGLGLATTFGLVRRIGGRIAVDSFLGGGTTFTIHLPTVAETGEIELHVLPPGGGGSVLVVEDDPFVRESVGYYLEYIGYTPLIAADAEQALEITKDGTTKIDVLLTDVMMPHQLGRDLANELRAIRPDLKVVYMSAHPREDLVERGRIEADAALIQKPFDEHRLGLLLHKLMQG